MNEFNNTQAAREAKELERAFFKGVTQLNNAPTISEEAMNYLKADYYCSEMPEFEACYDRLKQVAQFQGWGEMPNCETLKAYFKTAIPDYLEIKRYFKRWINYPSQM